MPLFSVQDLSASRGAKTLFSGVGFAVEAEDKVALIGVNGCGKTTLLSEIYAAYTTPRANMSFAQGIRLAYLPQLPTFDPKDSIRDHLFRGDTPVVRVTREYLACLDRIAAGDLSGETQLGTRSAEMDAIGAWDYEHRVMSLLKELNIHHLDQAMGTLSGGMVKKIALAQLFFEDADVLFLDEPTNHLDLETIDWMEGMVMRSRATVFMVTHDRYFLDRVCTRIFEIDQQKVFQYTGNYAAFLEQRAARLSAQQQAEKTIQSILRVELAWLRQGAKARSTKQRARKDRIDALQQRDKLTDDIQIDLGVSGRRLGKKILELKNITKQFGDQTVLRPFSYTFKEGDKIGILGPNGAGKSTLLNLISEQLRPDTGVVDIGLNTHFGYFQQHTADMDPGVSVLNYAKNHGEQITLPDGVKVSVSAFLEQFLFPNTLFHTPIGKLSGGERRRLQLVCMLLANPNFLLFDEPTNDLDVTTLSVLENFLVSFPGCVLVISHDRYFLDRVVDHLFVFDGKGGIAPFWGNYSDYAETQKQRQPAAPKPKPVPQEKTKPQKQGLSFKEQQEFKKLESEITTLEDEQTQLQKTFSDPTASPEDYVTAGKRLADIAETLVQKWARWETLAEKS